MKISESQIPIQNPGFQLEQFDNEILLYSMSSTIAVYLNETGYLIWCLCKDNRSIRESITLLEESYPEQGEHIRDDVVSVIKNLAEKKVIILTNE